MSVTPPNGALARILGVARPSDPFEVLGLKAGPVMPGQVMDALARRMAQVAMHRLSETAEGNDARLALHAAAAQLMDERIRAALLARMGLSPSAGLKAGNSPTGSGPKGPGPGEPLQALALRVLAAEGGWNPRAMRRLAMIAHAEGLPSSRLPGVVASLMRRPASVLLAGASVPGSPTPAPSARVGLPPGRQIAPHSSRSDTASIWPTVIISALSLLSILAIVATWSVLTEATEERSQQRLVPPPSPGAIPSEVIEPPPQDTARPVGPGSTPTVVPEAAAAKGPAGDAPDWAGAMLGMRGSSEPVLVEAVWLALQGLADTWTSLEPSRRAAAVAALVDLVYRLEEPAAMDLVGRLGGLLTEGQPGRGAWSAGVLMRLSRESNLSAGVDNATVATLSRALGPATRGSAPSFESGIAAWLERVGARWAGGDLPETEQLASWLDAQAALAGTAPELAEAAARAVLLGLLRGEPDPVQQQRAAELYERLSGRLTLPGNADSAAAVLSALADARIPTSRLAALFSSLRRRGDLSAFADQLDLRPNASDARRSELRAAIEAAWGSPSAGTWAQGELDSLARATLSRPVPATGVSTLAELVVTSRLVASASMLLWGRGDQAEQILSGLRAEPDRIAAGVPTPKDELDSQGADDWALRYLEAQRNIPVRQSLLAELVRSRPRLGSVAAELLMTEAVMGSPAQVRREAQDAVPLFADQASVLNAFLEVLPRAPQIESTRRLAETLARAPLPAPERADWPLQARRAVVARLLELLAGEGEGSRIDALAGLLAESYAQQLSPEPSGSPGVAADLEPLAQALRQAWIGELRRLDQAGASAGLIDRLDRASQSRLALADGSIQRFAALQVSMFEAAAETVLLERPELEPAVRALLAEVADQRRRARGVFEQMLMTERGMLRLWRARLGGQP